METVWFNGQFMPLSEASIGLEDRALQFADGIYEVIAAYDGSPVLLGAHLDRWERSAAGLRIESPYTREQRQEVITELFRRLGGRRAMVYGQLSRGTAKRAHPFPRLATPNEYWYARALPELVPDHYEKGVALISHPDERWARVWIKSTCLLPNVLAKQAAIEAGAFDALLVREDGIITETSAANAYAVKGGVVYTHPTDGRILPGCKRAMVLELARAAGVPVREERYSLEFACGSEEIFITSTTLNVVPVTTLDGRAVGNGQVGPVARLLNELVLRAIGRVRAEGAAA